jgi:small-conductance mechanosensitive channel
LRDLDTTAYGVTLGQWLLAAAILTLVYLTLGIVRQFLVRHLGKLADRTTTQWDDAAVRVMSRTRWYFLLIVAVQTAAHVVLLPAEVDRFLRVVSIIIVLIQVGVWGGALILFAVERYARREESDAGTRFAVQAVGYAVRFVLWALLVVTALQNFGINITALLTGLGVGGIAIALAVQNILGDLFAAIAIVVDRPFVVGDFIIVGELRGTVEAVGVKTTRIRSISGEQIVISNGELLKGRIHNYKRMQERRVHFSVDVTYDTPAEKVARIPAIVRSIVESQPATRFDRSHFLSFADSSLRIETVYYVLDPDYGVYADTQHAVNVALLRRFSDEEIEFAFPSRTVYWKPFEPGLSAREAGQAQ